MTTVKVKFRPSTVKDRPGTIVYVVTHRRLVRQITTGYKVFPHEWDEEHSKPIPSDNNSRMDIINQTTQRLHLDMARLDEIIKRFESQCRSYSSDNVVMEFRRTGEENTFFNFMENVIARLRQLNQIGTARNYRARTGQLQTFLGQRGYPN